MNYNVFTDIPGFERRKLLCLHSHDDFQKILLASKIIGELRSKYCTSVAFFSTRGLAEYIERRQGGYTELTGSLYAENLEDRDVHRLIDRASEMVEKKFIRAIIIDCLEDLDIDTDYYKGGIRAKRNAIKSELYWLAAGCNVRVLLFCPYSKSRKYDGEAINPGFPEILPQLNQ